MFHVGPTNSGKTHDALQALMASGRGTYASPLRMLANEAYERLAGHLGEERVGLVTGEERVNETAPIVCCTAEMTPMSGDLLVLDEVQWAADPDRGWAWTRLLLGGEYRRIHIVGAPDALPLVKAAFPDVEVAQHDRLCPLEVAPNPTRLADVAPGTAVVVFSRRAVYHVAGLLRSHGHSPAVLYGAMPPGARRAEIARFLAGDADVVVATDVIGHGINLPVATVLFGETQKFDGTGVRLLEAWEIAQIAGRAGRYGFEDKGVVGVLVGAGLSSSLDLVASSLTPTADVGDGLVGHRRVTHGYLSPTLEDLGSTSAGEFPERLKVWQRAAGKVAPEVGWVRPVDVGPLIDRLEIVGAAVGLENLDPDAAWRFARSPLNAEDETDVETLELFAKAVAYGEPLQHLVGEVPRDDLQELEVCARRAAALRWFTLAFPGVGEVTHEQAVAYESRVTSGIIAQVQRAIRDGVARCTSCNTVCPPWSRWCDACYRKRAGWSLGSSLGHENFHSDRVLEAVIRDELSRRRRQACEADLARLVAEDPALERPRDMPRPVWVILGQWLLERVPPEDRPAAVERLAQCRADFATPNEMGETNEVRASALWTAAGL